MRYDDDSEHQQHRQMNREAVGPTYCSDISDISRGGLVVVRRRKKVSPARPPTTEAVSSTSTCKAKVGACLPCVRISKYVSQKSNESNLEYQSVNQP